MGALNMPSAADIERVTRRLRSLSQRLEGIEDAIDRLEERLASAAAAGARLAGRRRQRLDEIARDLAALREAVAPERRARAARAGAPDGHRVAPERRVAGREPAAPTRSPSCSSCSASARCAPSGRGHVGHRRARTPPRRRGGAATCSIVAASISTTAAPRSRQPSAVPSRGS